MISLTEDEMKIVQDILLEYADGCEVFVFGSRVTLGHKKFSDLDLAFRRDEPLTGAWHSKIQLAFSESDLPYFVDIVDYNSVSPEFRRIIDKHAVKFHFG